MSESTFTIRVDQSTDYRASFTVSTSSPVVTGSVPWDLDSTEFELVIWNSDGVTNRVLPTVEDGRVWIHLDNSVTSRLRSGTAYRYSVNAVVPSGDTVRVFDGPLYVSDGGS